MLRPLLTITLRRIAVAAPVCATLIIPPVHAQQRHVTRYDAFIGSTLLNSSKISLAANGFHFQIGMRQRTWYSLGFDFSQASGDLTLTPDLLPSSLQQSLKAQLAALATAGRLPAGYALTVRVNSTTQTFAVGPQLAYRRWKAVTPFIRPSMGAIREVAKPAPADPIASAIIAGLAPEGRKRDWQGFYGVGGGFDINATKNFAFRIQADFVYDHLFNDILREGRHTVRFSVGPAFNFGRNIAR